MTDIITALPLPAGDPLAAGGNAAATRPPTAEPAAERGGARPATGAATRDAASPGPFADAMRRAEAAAPSATDPPAASDAPRRAPPPREPAPGDPPGGLPPAPPGLAAPAIAQLLPPSGNGPPADGKSLPAAPAPTIAAAGAPDGARGAAETEPLPAAALTRPPLPEPGAEASEPTRASTAATVAAADGAAASRPGAAEPASAAATRAGTSPDGGSARLDTLRADLLGSFEPAATDARSARNGGEAPTGDGRSAAPEPGFARILADAAKPGGAIAEFQLNTGQAPASAAHPADAAARSAGPDLDPLLAQRPLQPLADQAQWSRELGQRLLLMSDAGVHTARIRLHPEHLGQLDVTIEVEDDMARVWFAAGNGHAREAIESALPRLREMFGDKGLDLVRTDVSGDPQQYSAGRHDDGTGARAPAIDADASAAPPPALLAAGLRVSDRLLDVWA